MPSICFQTQTDATPLSELQFCTVEGKLSQQTSAPPETFLSHACFRLCLPLTQEVDELYLRETCRGITVFAFTWHLELWIAGIKECQKHRFPWCRVSSGCAGDVRAGGSPLVGGLHSTPPAVAAHLRLGFYKICIAFLKECGISLQVLLEVVQCAIWHEFVI